MASRTVRVLIDDLSGEELSNEDAETVTFGLDGVTYEIDLSADNAAALRDTLAPYVSAGRRVGGRRKAGSNARAASGRSPRAIREWAQEQGIDVPARGRIPSEIEAQYDAAH